ncbi:MAG: hypothetical protein D6731_20245 [Planctomycetota bacterium]|nr:MAG: hypothetical protein D6731_20245 [Planctomycetota bacterium]
MNTRRERSLLARVVTHIGVAFVAVELVVLAISVGLLWNSLVDERVEHVARYAAAVREQARWALLHEPSQGEGRALDAALDAALEGNARPGEAEEPPRFLPPSGAPVRVWVFRGLEAREFSRDGRLLAASEAPWPATEWPAVVRARLAHPELAATVDVSARRVQRLEPLADVGAPAVLYLQSSLRDVNQSVALFALIAFLAGGLALVFAATITMGFLRKALLLPLARIIEADNAARRGDREGGVIDAGDIPDDEVGAIMRSRNRLFEGMLRAQAQLDANNAELARQREELRVWGRELERLVQDKTAALLRAREILHRNEKLAALGRLAANVAHEINNPLACIAGYAEEAREELERGGEAGVVAEALTTIEEQAFRCKDILKRLLGLARADEVRPEPVELVSLVRETAALAERSLKSRAVELRLELPEGELWLDSDPTALQQIALNLIENAADAAVVGEPPAWVVVSLEGDAGEVCLCLRDSGRGIPAAELGRIFDPFYTTKPVGRGTGLGLAICQSLVERLGGRIEAGNADSGGAEFRVRLPLRPRAAEAPAAVPGTRSADASPLVEVALRAVGDTADPDA